jgi:hypothetical protein
MGTTDEVRRCIAQKKLGPPNTMAHTAGQPQGRKPRTGPLAEAVARAYDFHPEHDKHEPFGNAWNMRTVEVRMIRCPSCGSERVAHQELPYLGRCGDCDAMNYRDEWIEIEPRQPLVHRPWWRRLIDYLKSED